VKAGHVPAFFSEHRADNPFIPGRYCHHGSLAGQGCNPSKTEFVTDERTVYGAVFDSNCLLILVIFTLI
jgi:hypothetical protein